jgi:hypothetical protein
MLERDAAMRDDVNEIKRHRQAEHTKLEWEHERSFACDKPVAICSQTTQIDPPISKARRDRYG